MLISDSYRQHIEKQKGATDRYFAAKRRNPVTPLEFYVRNWRILEATRRLLKASSGRVNHSSRVLFLCAADAFEASALCDMGFSDVTISDISAVALAAATERDPRLKNIVLDVENIDFPDGFFDLVVVEDGLHHLRNPVRGFTEMLRVSKIATLFLEPHLSLVGSVLGTQWELDDGALNYVFRWNRRLVQDVASSFLVSPSFRNLSFSFWHHNRTYERIGNKLGMTSESGCKLIATIKFVMDLLMARWGNSFCGLILRHE